MKVSYIAINAVLLTSSASYTTATATSYSPPNGNTLEQCFPSNIPMFSYQGDDYIFSRMKYNSICTDSNDNQYQWGKIEGVWPSNDLGCSELCVAGHTSFEAHGCTSMQPDKLVGFEYDCDESACYCLYEKNTWSDENSPCFDSMGGLSNKGTGDVYNTDVQPGSTCYSLFVQPSSTPFPTESPTEPIGGNICTREPDYKCYKTGRPACCSDDEYTCPDFMTMCDNFPEDYTGTSYCTWSPDYTCTSPEWSSTRGRPNCCLEDGGDIMNCPIDPPACHPEDTLEESVGFLAQPIIHQAVHSTKITAKSNAQTTKNTYKNNAQSTKNTAKSNAQTTKDNAKSNADSTKNAYKNAYVPPQNDFVAQPTAKKATNSDTLNPPQEETDGSKVSYLRASRK